MYAQTASDILQQVMRIFQSLVTRKTCQIIKEHSIKIFVCKKKLLQAVGKQTGDQAMVLRWRCHTYTHTSTVHKFIEKNINVLHIFCGSELFCFWFTGLDAKSQQGVREDFTVPPRPSEDVWLFLSLCFSVARHPPGRHSVQPQTLKLLHQVQTEHDPSSHQRWARTLVFGCGA